MKGLSQSATLISWSGPFEGYYHVEMAVNGIKAVSFSFPATHLDNMASEEALGQYLERQARMLIDRYGDARHPRPDSIATEAEKLAYQDIYGS